MAGINRALLSESNQHIKASSLSSSNPCIFLSHISADKAAVREIGKYITDKGNIDIYLDEQDVNLQIAVSKADAVGITIFLEKGLSQSTHIMCLVSDETVKSWWVPYELGFAKKSGKPLSTLKIKGNAELPAYLEISHIIKGTKSLNAYLESVLGHLQKSATTRGLLNEGLIAHSQQNHPLDVYLNWDA